MLFQGHRHREMGHLVYVVGGAVQRIDDPAERRRPSRALGLWPGGRPIPRRAFFGQEAVVGKGGLDYSAYGLLGRKVGLGNQVGPAFLLCLDAAEPLPERCGTGVDSLFTSP